MVIIVITFLIRTRTYILYISSDLIRYKFMIITCCSLVAMATLYFLEYQKRSSLEWSTMASKDMLAVKPAHPAMLSTTPTYDPRLNSLLHSTISSLYTKHGPYTRGLDGGLSLKSNSLTTQSPNTKQQLYSQEITSWYPINHSGPQPKLDKNKYVKLYVCRDVFYIIEIYIELIFNKRDNNYSEFPGNWLSKSGAGAIPSNVDENDQGTDVDATPSNKDPIPLGRPIDCPAHFSELESPCQVEFSL